MWNLVSNVKVTNPNLFSTPLHSSLLDREGVSHCNPDFVPDLTRLAQ